MLFTKWTEPVVNFFSVKLFVICFIGYPSADGGIACRTIGRPATGLSQRQTGTPFFPATARTFLMPQLIIYLPLK